MGEEPRLKSPMPIVDTHVHVWRRRSDSVQWLSAARPLRIRDDYTGRRLQAVLRMSRTRAVVLIEAGTHPKSTLDLIRAANGLKTPHWFVAFLDAAGLGSSAVEHVRATTPGIVGARVRLGGEYSPREWRNLGEAFDALGQHGLSCDILSRGAKIDQILAIAAGHPQTRFIVNHIVPLAEHRNAPVSNLPFPDNVWLKVTPSLGSRRSVRRRELRALFNAVGSRRLLLGSDWPISSTHTDYSAKQRMLLHAVGPLLSQEREDICWRNAQDAYAISIDSTNRSRL